MSRNSRCDENILFLNLIPNFSRSHSYLSHPRHSSLIYYQVDDQFPKFNSRDCEPILSEGTAMVLDPNLFNLAGKRGKSKI
jgi:hypothetical protein